MRFSEEKKDMLSEGFELELQKAEMRCDAIGNSRKSEIDFARRQIANQYMRESVSEVD